jgi:uncharacterized protein
MKFFIAFLTILSLSACQSKKMQTETITTYAFRLKPGEDLKEGVEKQVKLHNIKAGWVATAVGSLTQYQLRFANQPKGVTGSGHFEIVSLVGTLGLNGSHLHLSISDSTGATIGGHLMQGCKVYTTAEIVLQATDKYQFDREKDGTTPWEELQVKEN